MSEEDDVTHSDEQELDGGIPSDTPDEILDFVRRNDVADKYTVMLKRKPEGGGVAGTLRNFTNYHPNVNRIGEEWGPGDYELVFSWRGMGINGKKEVITRGFKISLPEEAWAETHEDFLLAKAKARRSKQEAEWAADAAKIRAQGGVVGAQPGGQTPDQFDIMKKFLGIAKDLGVPIGGNVKQEKPGKSFAERLTEMAPAIVAIGGIVTPLVTAIISRPREKDDKTMLNTLLTHALNKPPADDPNKMVLPFLLSSITQIMDLKERMEPQEKETLVERIIGKLAPMVPAVVAMAAQGRAAVDNNPIVQQVRKSEDFRNLAGDVDALILFVNKQDAAYGFQQTNQILMVGGLERPTETLPNMAKFPSKGFKPDGAVDDGRDVKPPDAKPGEPSDETIE